MTSVTSVPPSAVTVSIRREPGQEVVGAARDAVVRGALLAGVGILVDGQVALRRIVADLVVECRVVDCDAQLRLLGDVADAPAPVVEGATVAQGGAVLVGGPQRHARQSAVRGPELRGAPASTVSLGLLPESDSPAARAGIAPG